MNQLRANLLARCGRIAALNERLQAATANALATLEGINGMTEEKLSKIRRRSAEEVIVAVPGGSFYERRVTAAVESAMNEEWWRGFYAGLRSADPDKCR